MKIENLSSLHKKFKQKKTALVGTSKKKSVVTGYKAAYALAIHENMTLYPPGMRLAGQPRRKPFKGRYWDPQGRAQPKFLEQPARELSNNGSLRRIVVHEITHGVPLDEAMKEAAEQIRTASMKMVPVMAGNLKNSAFTEIER